MGLRDAIEQQLALVEEEPRNIVRLQRAAELLQRAGDAREAAEMFSRIAREYLRDGFHLKAVALLKQVLTLEPRAASSRELLAEACAQGGSTQEAHAVYSALLEEYRWAGRAEDIARVLQAMAAVGVVER
ncbi:hypothetical protein OWM54_01600 [Myxococcus sp. MISCRS1]|uniref:hypothetical protein n=1 Tax=unclassified Myxococcus TaxID=2648731 RepID=UPI001CC0DF28|nr:MULTISPECIES: hypothetical protein [unclassified Myxococcus]MBZ4399403.1 hypothetical protein [Myxococcus sp. AS-1-15]MCY0995825.1 hypothetical protein [Myxococcus sp. MISCRS1]